MPFKFSKTCIPDVVLIEPRIFSDSRGVFAELFKASDFQANNVSMAFVQVNHSRSQKNVLRGLHYQLNPKAQAKLISVVHGEIFDVAVDIRRGSPTYGQWVADRDDTLLLFDEVEDVLDGSGSSGDFDMSGGNRNRSHFSKAWVNQQLEQNPVPVIWICNNHRYIDPAHLRRFLFHLEFRVPPRSVRQRIAERYFREFNVSEVMIKKLSLNAGLSPAQLESTARLLKLNGCHRQAESELLLETAIRQSMLVMGQSVSQNAAKSITPYRLDYLNVDSQVPLARMLEAMQKRPQATLCFYGPPGTGKTQLAEYLAEQLDQNLIVKRASDLLSKWLGETEQTPYWR